MLLLALSPAAVAGLLTTALLALLLDVLIGDPPALYRRVPHPVALLGRLIAFGDRRLNREGDGPERRLLGLLLTAAVVALAAALGWLIATALAERAWGWMVEALLASTLLAYRGLYDAVRRVARGLEESLAAGRAAVAEIVGRDPELLDESGVARAAAESAAENFSDGVVAPLFWFLLLGLPGLAAYKAINTLDSMLGHRTPRYEDFGKAAARLDDAANWLPARLAALTAIAAASVLPTGRGIQAVRVAWRDGGKHRSPNAGPVEAAFAGALGLRLSGPRSYHGRPSEEPWIGDGAETMTFGDLRRVLDLYVGCGVVLLAALALPLAWLSGFI